MCPSDSYCTYFVCNWVGVEYVDGGLGTSSVSLLLQEWSLALNTGMEGASHWIGVSMNTVPWCCTAQLAICNLVP